MRDASGDVGGVTVADLGELGLIARVIRRLGGPPPPAGAGDDAAVIAAPDGRLVATTDLLAEGVHFRFDWSNPFDVGRKAAAANLADVAAMGAVPTALLVGIALPATTPVALVDAVIDGLQAECAVVGAIVVGGDIIASPDRLTLAVTALGDLQGRAPVTRATTTPGSLVLAGRIGWSAAGLALLRAGVDEEQFAALLAAHRCPTPPYELGPALAAAGAVAMCDVSDGLLADVGQLAAASGGQARVRSRLLVPDRLLVAAGEMLDVHPLEWMLTGGEDHALLAVLPAGVTVPGAVEIGDLRPAAGGGVRLVGWRPAGLASGHDHFSRGD